MDKLYSHGQRLKFPRPGDRHTGMLTDPTHRLEVSKHLQRISMLGVGDLLPPPTAKEAPREQREQVDALERRKQLDGFLNAAGQTLSIYTDGPGGRGYHGYGPNGAKHLLNYDDTRDQLSEIARRQAKSGRRKGHPESSRRYRRPGYR